MNKPRLIDADAFLERMKGTDRYFSIKFDIEEQPTVDAVEVVRCKDCIVHNKCSTEDTFKFAGIKNPFCCAGKKVK